MTRTGDRGRFSVSCKKGDREPSPVSYGHIIMGDKGTAFVTHKFYVRTRIYRRGLSRHVRFC